MGLYGRKKGRHEATKGQEQEINVQKLENEEKQATMEGEKHEVPSKRLKRTVPMPEGPPGGNHQELEQSNQELLKTECTKGEGKRSPAIPQQN